MANIIMFIILAVVILAAAVLSVTTKRIMRAATFLLFVLFGVAGIYFLLDYTFLGAAQISVYAGGITMLYIFAIQLVSKHNLQGMRESISKSRLFAGAIAALVGVALIFVVLLKNRFVESVAIPNQEVTMEQIGSTLMGADKYQYVLPFEFISLFLLACIIGGIVISRKDK
ncbi:MAG: NADH-quinone oxidoreductase subunit J [Prevotella sp.]|nr:NADH-quinone oxidoreductase subunit J [Prevotella sp.]